MSNQNYKRTVAGSVGAGMGAIFNGSGRTYYILEHKTQSQFHNIGESQKIIIDQIELGRASSCQVRWEDTPQFEMVSRRHAAIVRDGNNWELIHLSTSNPTLVNGRPVQGHYYLQSGDEIQLAANGPRMGFIVPQGTQAATSSIRLTERMGLFRQQALAPYKRALWALTTLLILVIVGFGCWNYYEHKQFENNRKEHDKQIEILIGQRDAMESEIHNLKEQLKRNPGDYSLKKRVSELEGQLTETKQIINDYEEERRKDIVVEEVEEKTIDETKLATTNEEIEQAKQEVVIDDGASNNVNDYRNSIYTLEISDIEIGYRGNRYPYKRDVKKFVVGTGFVVDGYFYTARSNIDPWMYREYINDFWRNELAELRAMGCDIYIKYKAYSASGTRAAIEFNSDDILVDRSSDSKGKITVTKQFYNDLRAWGIPLASWITYKNIEYDVEIYSANSHNLASFRVESEGLPVDKAKARNLKLGETVAIAGYSGRQDKLDMGSLRMYNYSITTTGQGNYIALQGEAANSWGFVGSPAFFQGEDEKYRCIGIFVGNFKGECRVVPLRR